MAEPPRRRPPGPPPGPPPLPQAEPFRTADTPPSGTLVGLPRVPRHEIRPLAPEPVDAQEQEPATHDDLDRLIRALRQEIVFLRDSRTASSAPPGSLRTRSRAAVAGIVTGKYAGVALLVGIVLRAVAKQWPQFGELIEGVLQAVGL